MYNIMTFNILKLFLPGIFCFISLTMFSQTQEYPALYKSLELPEYENAILVKKGHQEVSLRDGLRLTLETPDEYGPLRSYYEAELAAKGWELEETIATRKMREAGMLDQMPFNGVFRKGNRKFQITSSRSGDKTLYSIIVLEED